MVKGFMELFGLLLVASRARIEGLAGMDLHIGLPRAGELTCLLERHLRSALFDG